MIKDIMFIRGSANSLAISASFVLSSHAGHSVKSTLNYSKCGSV